jgi:hypothetical protein
MWFQISFAIFHPEQRRVPPSSALYNICTGPRPPCRPSNWGPLEEWRNSRNNFTVGTDGQRQTDRDRHIVVWTSRIEPFRRNYRTARVSEHAVPHTRAILHTAHRTDGIITLCDNCRQSLPVNCDNRQLSQKIRNLYRSPTLNTLCGTDRTLFGAMLPLTVCHTARTDTRNTWDIVSLTASGTQVFRVVTLNTRITDFRRFDGPYRLRLQKSSRPGRNIRHA